MAKGCMTSKKTFTAIYIIDFRPPAIVSLYTYTHMLNPIETLIDSTMRVSIGLSNEHVCTAKPHQTQKSNLGEIMGHNICLL